jgi:type I restriction enzyme S subunit
VAIPVPSRAEQERIVTILDGLDALMSKVSLEISTEIEARRKQYEYYRSRLLTFEERVA